MFIFLGTPEEYRAVAHLLPKQPTSRNTTVIGEPSQEIADVTLVDGEEKLAANIEPPTGEQYRTMMIYKSLGKFQRAAIKALYDVRGEWMGRADLCTIVGIPHNSLPGSLGGLGMRVLATHGLKRLARKHTGVGPAHWFIEHRRVDGDLEYRLNDHFRTAIDEFKLLAGT